MSDREIMNAKNYGIFKMECTFCNSNEITYNSLICDSYCADCGQWQEEVGRLITK